MATVTPYLLDTTATQNATGAQVRLQRKINNYLVPIFQFGMFSNEDMEVHPGPHSLLTAGCMPMEISTLAGR